MGSSEAESRLVRYHLVGLPIRRPSRGWHRYWLSYASQLCRYAQRTALLPERCALCQADPPRLSLSDLCLGFFRCRLFSPLFLWCSYFAYSIRLSRRLNAIWILLGLNPTNHHSGTVFG